MVTQHGFHYTDPTMDGWIHYDPNRLEFSGIGPYVEEETEYLYDVYGYDINNNWSNTTFTIIVVPNAVCEQRDQVNMTCQLGSFCSFTILDDMFREEDQDSLTYELDSGIPAAWLQFSSYNHSFFGVPNEENYEGIMIFVEATDPLMASCVLDVEVKVGPAVSLGEEILWKVGVALCILIVVIMTIALVHCGKVGGKWDAIQTKFNA